MTRSGRTAVGVGVVVLLLLFGLLAIFFLNNGNTPAPPQVVHSTETVVVPQTTTTPPPTSVRTITQNRTIIRQPGTTRTVTVGNQTQTVRERIDLNVTGRLDVGGLTAGTTTTTTPPPTTGQQSSGPLTITVSGPVTVTNAP